jgi:outer membrane protein assembly factor BamB
MKLPLGNWAIGCLNDIIIQLVNFMFGYTQRRNFGRGRQGSMTALPVTIVSVIILAVISPPAIAEDWPTFRHDRQFTASTSERLALPLEPIWVFRSRQSQHPPSMREKGTVEFSPERARYELPISAAGDSLFFTSAADGRIVCLEASTAKVRWEFIAEGSVNRVPTYYEGKIYAGSDDGHVYCLDAKTGKRVWSYKAAPANRWLFSYNQLSSVWTVRTNIVVEKGVAYFGCGTFPHDGTFIMALDANTGRLLWKNDTHSETSFRWVLSPNGNIYATDENLYIPNDVKPFRLALFHSFKRVDGRHDGSDPQSPGFGQQIRTIPGAIKGDKRYLGNSMQKITEEVDPNSKQKKVTFSPGWKIETPGWSLDAGSIEGYPPARGAPLVHNPDLCAVIATEGAAISIRYKKQENQQTIGKVSAHGTADGKELWTSEIGEWPNEVIAANGRVYVSTRDGTIYAYAAKGSKKHGVINEPVNIEPFGDGPSLTMAAGEIVRQSGIQEGYALVLDCTTGELARELALQTKMHICAVFDDEDQATAARQAASRANMHVSRILVWLRKPGEALPLPPRYADLIVSESAVSGGAPPKIGDALTRLLKPLRGQAIIGGLQNESGLGAWIKSTGQDDWSLTTAAGFSWAKRTGPRMKGAGGWTHALGDAGNTMCSNDSVLKPPLGIVWVGEPFSARRSRGISPAILADGVLIHQTTTMFDTKGYTEGFDQYTGRKLWRLPATVTDTVAAHGAIFLRYLEHVTQIDPWTGKKIKTIQPPFDGKWGKMTADRDGKTLYLRAYGETGEEKTQWSVTLAYDVAKGKVMWNHGGPGKPEQGADWSAVSDDRMYFLGGKPTDAERAEAEAEMLTWLKKLPGEEYKLLANDIKKHNFELLKAIDTRTGNLLYRKAINRTNAGGGWTTSVVTGGRRQYQPLLLGAVIANGGAVVFGSTAGADKSWAVWPSGGYKGRALSVYDGATGKLLWYRFANYRARPVVTQDFVYAEPWGFHLRSGEPKTRVHPVTGENAQWAFARYDKQCGTFAGSRYFLFGRSRGVGYQDLFSDQGLYTILNSRSSCWVDTSSGGGMMIKPPHAIGCKCDVSMPFTFALAPVPTPLALPQVFAQPGSPLPVKHLYLDFGATGDRRDNEGRLWLAPTRGKDAGKLLLSYQVEIKSIDGAGHCRRSAVYTPIENTDTDFVFASAARGLDTATIPIAEEDKGGGTFNVRLGFSALPGDQPGQRVFDVKLNGKTVLKDFDIIKESGKADRALWKEFTMPLKKELTLNMVAKTGSSDLKQMPLINALQILRSE